MRNLKRALSLTLASVMLLGMMVVGSSAAAGYDDVADTDNVEAIEVLQAIEVMVGDERGFGPERPVNRAEMAVVMAKLLSLDYNYYSTSCPFNDVYDWAQGYVGAAAANGIVSGRGEGIYDPGATVTAVEAASMLMRALGYFKYANDTADGFEVSTVRQGTIIGIFDGVGSSATEPMTRNQIAQMVLNALQSAVVEPDGNTINLTTPDGTVLTGKVNYVSVTSAKPFAHAISWTQATSIGSTNDGWIVELGERLYDGKLQLTEDIDVFGRPSRKWEYDGKGIGTYAKKELLDKEYVGDVTGKDLFDLLGATTIKDYDVYAFVDGVWTDGAGAKDALGGAYFNAADMNKNNKANVGATGTGVLTQVYVDHDKDEVYVVVINTYLAIANKDYDEKKEEVDITAYSIDKKNSIGEYVKVGKNGNEKEGFKLAIEDFPKAADIKKNDALLVTVADGEVQTFKPAEVLSAVTISAFSFKSSVTVDGTKYNYTTTAGYKYDDNINVDYTKVDLTNLKDRTYNVYLDVYGNLIGVEEVEAVKNYVFITGIDLNGSNRANRVADASAIFLDGTMDAIKINMTKSELNVHSDADGDTDDRNSVLNTWCTYTKNGDVYTVKEVSDVGVTTVGGSGQTPANVPTTGRKLAQFNQQSTTTDMTIDSKNYRMYGGGAKSNEYYNVYGDVDTVYITAKLGELLKGSGVDGDGANYGIIKGVSSVTTGIANANLTAWTNAKAVSQANADDSKVKGTPGLYPQTSSGIYGLYNDKGLIIAAVVVGEDAGTAKDLVYVHSSGLKEEIDNGDSNAKAAGDGLWTWTREVVRDGEVVLLTEVGDYYNGDHSLANMEQYCWYQIRTNAEGNVIEAKKADVLNTQSRSRYVTDYKLINDNVEVEPYDTVLYLTNDGPKAANKTSKGGYSGGFYTDLEVKGTRTLAVTGEEGSGIWFSDDVNVVLQYWNRNKQEKDIFKGEGIDDLKEMVDIVNDNNADRGNNHYFVSALIENGRATSIVIYDSYNNYKRPSDVKVPGSNGAVSYAADLSDAVDGAISGDSVTVNGNGRVSANFTLKAPDWADTSAINPIDSISYEVWLDGEYDHDGQMSTAIVSALNNSDKTAPYDTFSVKNLLINDNTYLTPAYAKGHSVSLVITEIVWERAVVEYWQVDADGKEVRQLSIASGGTDTLPVRLATTGGAPTAAAITFTLNAANVGGNFTVTGATEQTGTFNGTVSASAGNSTVTYLADGREPVKVLVKPTGGELAVVCDVKVQGAAAQLHSDTLGAATRTDGIKVTNADKIGTMANAQIYVGVRNNDFDVAEGQDTYWSIRVQANAATWDPTLANITVKYTITGTERGSVNGEFTIDDQHFNYQYTVPYKVTKDMNLQVTEIVVNEAVFPFTADEVVFSNSDKTMTVKFNKAATMWNPENEPDGSKHVAKNITVTTSTPSQSDGQSVEVELNAKGELVLTFAQALVAGDEVNLDATVMSGADYLKQCDITVGGTVGKLTGTITIDY